MSRSDESNQRFEHLGKFLDACNAGRQVHHLEKGIHSSRRGLLIAALIFTARTAQASGSQP